jgi:hypothetical protein
MTILLEQQIFTRRMKGIFGTLTDECVKKKGEYCDDGRCRIYDNSPFARNYLDCPNLNDGGQCKYQK